MMSGAAKASEYTQVRSDTDTSSGLLLKWTRYWGGGGKYMKSKLLIMDIKGGTWPVATNTHRECARQVGTHHHSSERSSKIWKPPV